MPKALRFVLCAALLGCAAPGGELTDDVLIAEDDMPLHETSRPGTQTIFVNFEGARVADCDGYCSDAPGSRSWAIDEVWGQSRVDFARYDGGAAARAQIVRIIEEAFGPYDVYVTTSRPAAGPYTMVIVSPTWGPHHGVAPLDCGNRNASDIAFVYEIGGSSPGWIGQAAVHELGHSFGLSHVTSGADFMQWASSGRAFTRSSYDHAHPSGRCFDGETQDAPAMLSTNLGGHSHAPPVFDGTFADDDGSVHEANIERLYAAGITVGCRGGDAPRFCPDDPVTRGQMAVFLTRALGLPRSAVDHFTDDDGTYWEGAANSVADAGITVGCGGTRYCGADVVTREQMATFLSRALALPASGTDHFDDDDGSVHEANIDKIAEVGVTVGCGPRRYCPLDPVTREQMATFLVRAFGL